MSLSDTHDEETLWCVRNIDKNTSINELRKVDLSKYGLKSEDCVWRCGEHYLMLIVKPYVHHLRLISPYIFSPIDLFNDRTYNNAMEKCYADDDIIPGCDLEKIVEFIFFTEQLPLEVVSSCLIKYFKIKPVFKMVIKKFEKAFKTLTDAAKEKNVKIRLRKKFLGVVRTLFRSTYKIQMQQDLGMCYSDFEIT